jgi:hypothetical protein
LNRKHILGASLALTSLATGGVLVATNTSRGAAAGPVPDSHTLVASGEMVMTTQDKRGAIAGQRRARGDAAAKAAAVKAAAARAAANRAASAARTLSASRPPSRASRSTGRAPVYSGDARGIARAMLPAFGWSVGEFPCLDSLWARESGWRVGAANASGAYGIPQALPGSKMAAYGSDWRTSPRTQITWGLHYVQGRYGSPCGAWSHFQSHGWY